MPALSPPLRLAFYGDDFTGATDALEVLSSAGWRCALFLQEPDEATLGRYRGLDAIGIAGHSRTYSPSQMDQWLAPALDWLARSGAPLLHYKVCSTFDSAPDIGSIGHVLRLARARLPGSCPTVVAATPHLQRHCVFGHLFARAGTDGQVYRIDRHPIMSVHPVTPMTESDLALHLHRQGGLRIDNAMLPEVRAGVGALLQRLAQARADGADAVLLDGLDGHDIHTTGEALLALGRPGEPAFVVGGSGVEHALASAWDVVPGQSRTRPSYRRRAVGQVLAVSGSASALSAAQIEAAVAIGFHEVPIDPVRLLMHDGAHAEQVVDEAVSAWRRGASVVLHTARGPGDPRLAAVRRSRADGGADGSGSGNGNGKAWHDTGRRLAESLGRLVRHLVERQPVQRLLLSGGDSSSAIARALDVRVVEMAAVAAPGAPLCRVLESERVPGIEIAFKGGQMGSRGYFCEALNDSDA